MTHLEALESVKNILDGRFIQDDFFDGSTLKAIKDVVTKALDNPEPMRNCDKFDDYKSAKDYFLENELWKYNRNLTPEYWFGVWLFELADKGGAEATTVDAV